MTAPIHSKADLEKAKQEWLSRYKSREGRAIARRAWEACTEAHARAKLSDEEIYKLGVSHGMSQAKAGSTNELLKHTNISSSPTPAEENLREQWPREREEWINSIGAMGKDPYCQREGWNACERIIAAPLQAALSRAEAEIAKQKQIIDLMKWNCQGAERERDTLRAERDEARSAINQAAAIIEKKDRELSKCHQDIMTKGSMLLHLREKLKAALAPNADGGGEKCDGL